MHMTGIAVADHARGRCLRRNAEFRKQSGHVGHAKKIDRLAATRDVIGRRLLVKSLERVSSRIVIAEIDEMQKPRLCILNRRELCKRSLDWKDVLEARLREHDIDAIPDLHGFKAGWLDHDALGKIFP